MYVKHVKYTHAHWLTIVCNKGEANKDFSVNEGNWLQYSMVEFSLKMEMF